MSTHNLRLIVASLGCSSSRSEPSQSGTVWWRRRVRRSVGRGLRYTAASAQGDLGRGARCRPALWLVGHPSASRASLPADDRVAPLRRQPIYVAFTLTLWTPVPTWTPISSTVAGLVLTGYCPDRSADEGSALSGSGSAPLSWRTRGSPAGFPGERASAARNDLSIYGPSTDWWGGDARWLQALRRTAARLAAFNPIVGD